MPGNTKKNIKIISLRDNSTTNIQPHHYEAAGRHFQPQPILTESSLISFATT